jgi:hypothetical protein
VSSTGGQGSDPALSLWRTWRKAAARAAALCRRQQHLETKLIHRVGFPRTQVRPADEEGSLTVFSLEEIAEIFESEPEPSDCRREAEADFLAHQARWDAADQEIGYSDAKGEECNAVADEQYLVDRMATTPAFSLAGIVGKLDLVLREGEPWEGSTEFPWPHIRSALADLIRIKMAREADSTWPGNARGIPRRKASREGCGG